MVWRLALACAWTLGLLLGLRFLAGRHESFPFDDTFIILDYARNFFERFEIAFNAGVPSTGITSPASMAIVAAAYGLVRDWTAAALFLSLFGLFAAFGAGVLLARKALGDVAALVFAVLFPLSGRFWYHGLSGMDTMLFCAAAGWALFFALCDRPIPCGAVLGLGWMVRPEIVFVALPAGAWFLKRRGVRSTAVLALVAAGMASPWIAFCLKDTGTVFPATLLAKTSLQSGGMAGAQDFLTKALAFWIPTDAFSPGMNFHPDELRLAGMDKWLQGVPVLLAGLVAMAFAGRPARHLLVMILSVLGLHFAAVFGRGAYMDVNFHRYFILNYFFAALAAAGLVALGLEQPRRWLRLGAAVGLAAAMAASTRYALWAAKSYQFWCRHTLLLDGQTGIWIGQNLPPDAVIGLHNAGCVKWFGQRKTVDFAALTTTKMHERLMQEGFLRMVYDEGVEYFAYHGDEVWAKYGFPHMSQSPYFEKLPAPGRGVCRVRRDLLANLFALDDTGSAKEPAATE